MSAPALPPLLADLRAFVAQRPFINPQAADAVFASRQNDDAAAVLRQLAVIGHITQVQAEALVAEFHQMQMAHARSIVVMASAQGLVPAALIENAVASYAPMAFTVTIQDHLVGSGILTRSQADTLGRQASHATTGWQSRVRGIHVLNAIALVLLLYALLSNTWWGAPGFRQGLLGAERATTASASRTATRKSSR